MQTAVHKVTAQALREYADAHPDGEAAAKRKGEGKGGQRGERDVKREQRGAKRGCCHFLTVNLFIYYSPVILRNIPSILSILKHSLLSLYNII